jgi:hypothetical protein
MESRFAEFTVRKKSDGKNTKVQALLEEGALNSAPEKVRDAKFRSSEFFDPHDIVQVKYEMLRRVSTEKASVVSATEEYGVSERRSVTNIIQMIGDVLIRVLSSHFVDLHDGFRRCSERTVPRRRTLNCKAGQHARAPSHLYPDFRGFAHTIELYRCYRHAK